MMMLWARWIELYCAAMQEFMRGELPRSEEPRPSATVIDMADERAKRRRQAMRAL